MSEKQKIAVRIFHEKFWKTKMGEDIKQCQSEWMKSHASDYRKMRKNTKGEK